MTCFLAYHETGYMPHVLVTLGLSVPLVLAAWRGLRLALFGGVSWGVLGLIFQRGDLVSAAVVFLIPPLIGLALAASVERFLTRSDS